VPEVAATLSRGGNPNSNAPGRRHEDDDNIVAIAYNPHRTLQKDGSILEGFKPDETIDALHQPTGNKEPLIVEAEVRRLTPTECCRLQGFPDDWFGTPNEAPDSPRYAALGDAVTVNVAEWIGERIG
jgi:site-specific DNA-cytosine methylase